MPEADRRLREVSQLRKLWRSFRDPQDRREDERLSRPITSQASPRHRLQEPISAYGHATIQAAVRLWWCEHKYEAIVELIEQLDSRLLEYAPLIRVYFEEAKLRLSDSRQ